MKVSSEGNGSLRGTKIMVVGGDRSGEPYVCSPGYIYWNKTFERVGNEEAEWDDQSIRLLRQDRRTQK